MTPSCQQIIKQRHHLSDIDRAASDCIMMSLRMSVLSSSIRQMARMLPLLLADVPTQHQHCSPSNIAVLLDNFCLSSRPGTCSCDSLCNNRFLADWLRIIHLIPLKYCLNIDILSLFSSCCLPCCRSLTQMVTRQIGGKGRTLQNEWTRRVDLSFLWSSFYLM